MTTASDRTIYAIILACMAFGFGTALWAGGVWADLGRWMRGRR